MPQPAELSIGQVAEQVGLSVHTLRFYEREGILVRPVDRSSTGHRMYRESDVQWLRICVNLRSSGMPLPAIRRYVELVRQGQGNESERLALLREHRDRVKERMAELQACLDTIDFKVTYYESHVAQGTAHRLWTGDLPPE
ncbi:DNA-binding transcriptional MerR regulator [Stackebrandtia endophytica]|uniref:DNA-binding transcriptional MerR regulator n=1 Tax=Stackebrandtia endophytica TaxID=1496996 RepID=A0A543AZ80_9ACTN|nr:MerR family transcriptional regulator [Stackebrandtia endophytica]TQL77866.1 DNA-binding transcriptional MerR regulator [Stackebrandtia endophytica]